jgi:RecB family endonuclease NucS
MKGHYKTTSGEAKKVVSFDAENKVVAVEVHESRVEHFGESEYSKWESLAPEKEVVIKETKIEVKDDKPNKKTSVVSAKSK